MKKSLLLFILMILIMFSGCSREIHVYCDCAEAIGDIQLPDTQEVMNDSQATGTNADMPVSKLQFIMMEVLCDMFRGEWSYVDTVRGEVDTEKYFAGVELVPTKLVKYEELYSMIAIYPNTDIYVVVKIVHDTHTDDAIIVERYYANSEGKVLRDEYLQNFLLGYQMYENRIIPTNHYELGEYFYNKK